MKRLLSALLAIAVVAGAVLGWKLRRAERATQTQALRADSLEAANDRQRTIFVRGIELQSRRVVQLALERDSIDRALDVESRLRAQMQLQVVALGARLAAKVTEDTGGTRRAAFHVRQAPYTADAAVTLPRPPAEGTLDLRVQLDSIGLRARVVCGAAVAGVRPATFLLEGPPWATLRLEQLDQDPAVCNAKPGLPPPRRSGLLGDLAKVALGILGWELLQ